jgi:hypothetical protein
VVHPLRRYWKKIISGVIFALITLFGSISDALEFVQTQLNFQFTSIQFSVSQVILVVIGLSGFVLLAWDIRKSRHLEQTVSKSAEVAVSSLAEQLKIQNLQTVQRLRKERYVQLNREVFTALADYAQTEIPRTFGFDAWSELKLIYSISHLRANPFFVEAEKHFEIDLPNLLSMIEEIEESSEKFVEDVEQFRGKVVSRVRQSLSTIGPTVSLSEYYTNEPNTIYLDGVSSALAERWVSTILFSKGKTIELFLHYEGDKVIISARHIATISSPSLREELRRRVEELCRDREILKELLGLTERRTQLQDRIDNEVRKPVYRTFIFPIRAERYDTSCQFCPQL